MSLPVKIEVDRKHYDALVDAAVQASAELEAEGLAADNESILASVMADYATAKKFALAEFDYRDVASVTQKINGKKVTILFAGDMSWGDEPQGTGYAVMKALYNLGVGDMLWKSVPWDRRKK